MDFIPAKKSRLFIWFFDWYTRLLLKRRFRKVIIHKNYVPSQGSRTIYFINHNYWWDGLLPLYLNRKIFRQNAYAIMEDKQMKEFPFFRRIGAFSVNLEHPRSVISSLRYALQSLKNPNACLFIYPEGEIMPVSEAKPEFKGGLAWLYQKSKKVDFVPVAFYIDPSKSSKPDLFISVGKACNPDNSLNTNELTCFFEEALYKLLQEVKSKEFTRSRDT